MSSENCKGSVESSDVYGGMEAEVRWSGKQGENGKQWQIKYFNNNTEKFPKTNPSYVVP